MLVQARMVFDRIELELTPELVVELSFLIQPNFFVGEAMAATVLDATDLVLAISSHSSANE